jgi:hypothetical protein
MVRIKWREISKVGFSKFYTVHNLHWTSVIVSLLVSPRIIVQDQDHFPTSCVPRCGRCTHAELDPCLPLAGRRKIVVVVYMFFFHQNRALLPRSHQSLLGRPHLFVHFGIVTSLTSLRSFVTVGLKLLLLLLFL